MFDELRVNEYNDLIKLGWLVEGTDADAGKFKLSAEGLKQYDRLIESLPAKHQVLAAFTKDANAFKAPAAIKGFMN